MSKFQVRKNTQSDLSRLSARSEQRTMIFDLAEYKKDGTRKSTLTTVIFVNSNNRNILIKNDKWQLSLTLDFQLGFEHPIPTIKKNGVNHTNIEVLENIIELAGDVYSLFPDTMGSDWILIAFDCYYRVKARAKSACSFEISKNTLADWIESIEAYASHIKDENKIKEVVTTLTKTGIFSISDRDELKEYFGVTDVVNTTATLPVTEVTTVIETVETVETVENIVATLPVTELVTIIETITTPVEKVKGKKNQIVTQPVTGF